MTPVLAGFIRGRVAVLILQLIGGCAARRNDAPSAGPQDEELELPVPNLQLDSPCLAPASQVAQ
jgi:hypothetical protein